MNPRPQKENDLLSAALAYAARGWRVLPLHTPVNGRCSCGKACGSVGKHPRTPHGVKDATTDPATIRRWWEMWPDANVGIATGFESGIVAMDVDPRHGGDQSLAALERQYGALPDTPRTSTGGGGHHHLFAHPGQAVKSKPNVALGIDIRGDGGFIVAPPSLHASGRRYEWTDSADPATTELASLPDWLMDMLTRRRVHSTEMPLTGGPILEGARNATLTSYAGTMRRRGMTRDAIFAALRVENAARGRPPLGEAEVQTIADSVGRYDPTGPEDDSPREVINAIRRASGLKAFERRQAIVEWIKRDSLGRGSLLSTPIGSFYFLNETKTLYGVSKDKLDYAALIEDRYGLNPQETEFTYLLNALLTESYLRGQKCDVHRLALYHRERGVLYVSRFNGEMHRLDGEEVKILPNGAEGVFFLDEPGWEPYRYLGDQGAIPRLLHKLLIEPINFAEGPLTLEDQRHVYGIWIFALFFESLHPTKPLLLLVGPKGAGKSITLRKLVKILFGAKAEVLGIERDREDAFVAAVTTNYIAVFDNVDGRIPWLNDQLARLATGQIIPRRKLYTTNERIDYPSRCYVALTARTPKFRRDDVVDRLVLFYLDRFHQFVPEQRLIREILQHRDALWTELLNDLNTIVKVLQGDQREFSSPFRLGDFAEFAWRVGDAHGQGQAVLEALEKMAGAQSEFLLEDDPLAACLALWLENPSNHGRWVDAATLFEELRPLADKQGLPWSYKSSLGLGKRLANVVSNLKTLFTVEVRTNPHGRTAQYALGPVTTPDDAKEKMTASHLTKSP